MFRSALSSIALFAAAGIILATQQGQAGSLQCGCCCSSGCSPVKGRASTSPTRSSSQPESPDPPLPLVGKIASLSVKVPANATVFVNDSPTLNKGTDREYISRNLQTGKHYNYTVRVEFFRNGRSVLEKKSVQLTAGQSATLDFTQGAAQLVNTPPRGRD
jgi:uncharacterized protein (TIGR03000 family)